MFKKMKAVSVVLAVTLTFSAVNIFAQANPKLVDVNPSGNEGDWYIGDIPAGSSSKPVIVFVQGMGGKAENWWGDTKYYGHNDMYDKAYNSGYRTAFVNFRDADGNPGDMWRNGEVLKNRLADICKYYGVSKVNLVCHSKGGVDAQSAIVHYGANQYVNTVFTLSTPHWGSPLADLCYSSYASWLAEILGKKDDATYCLQTAYMSDFRNKTDNRNENNSIKYYTAAGKSWGPTFSAMWFGGLYLSGTDTGSSDGVVPAKYAMNPRATHVTTGNYNHDNIRMGSKSWSFIEPRIRTISQSTSALKEIMNLNLASAGRFSDLADLSSHVPTDKGINNDSISKEPVNLENSLVKGGNIENGETIKVPVESSAKSVTINLMVSDSSIEAELVSPDNKKYGFNKSKADDMFFNGATLLSKVVDKPKAGYYEIKLKSKVKGAYMMVASYDSSLNAELKVNASKVKKGQKLTLKSSMKKGNNKVEKPNEKKVVLSKTSKYSKTQKVKEEVLKDTDSDMTMPKSSGVYNIDMSYKGVLEDGSPYERTVIKSVLVED